MELLVSFRAIGLSLYVSFVYPFSSVDFKPYSPLTLRSLYPLGVIKYACMYLSFRIPA